MADKIDEAKYDAMITALNSFAAKVSEASAEIQSLSSNCVQALGEEDKAVGPIAEKVRVCTGKYAEAAEQAQKIAQQMQQELEEAHREDEIWGSDD